MTQTTLQFTEIYKDLYGGALDSCREIVAKTWDEAAVTPEEVATLLDSNFTPVIKRIGEMLAAGEDPYVIIGLARLTGAEGSDQEVLDQAVMAVALTERAAA